MRRPVYPGRRMDASAKDGQANCPRSDIHKRAKSDMNMTLQVRRQPMKRFQVGDPVRVACLSSSPWQDSRGTIIEILDRHQFGDSETLQECAVRFGEEHCWFMAQHLVRSVPARF